MRVLCLASYLPTTRNPRRCIFLKEQNDTLRQLGIEIDTFLIGAGISGLKHLNAIYRFHTEVEQNNYQVIHAQYGLNACIAYTQFRLPVVVTFWGDDVLENPAQNGRHTILSKILVGLNKLLVRRASAVIVQSEEMKRRLGRTDAYIIPFGVDLNLFQLMKKEEACRKLGFLPDRKTVLFANDPTLPVKQFALARKAVDLVKKKIAGIDLVTTGDEPREKIPLYMNACDVLILTSLHEGSPMVVKEAMACNLPVVSVDVGDVRQVIGTTKNCFVTSRNPQEMAERIIQVINSGERSNGRENICHLEIKEISKQIIRVYKQVLE